MLLLRITLSVIFVTNVFLSPLLPSRPAFAHGGGLNAEGCHTQKSTGGYHCHKNSGAQDGSALNENAFNNALAKYLGGTSEKALTYQFKDSFGQTASGTVRIDIETASEVIEGGLDKRSSLDSIQQAIFASTLTGKKPAVAIYDSDGNWGKIEHRIQTVAKSLRVKFYWVSNGKVHVR